MKELCVNPFSQCLLWDKAETMVEVWRRATIHIEAKESHEEKTGRGEILEMIEGE